MKLNYSQKLIAGTLALVLVTGMTIPAFAGSPPISSCTVDPDEVTIYLGPKEESDPIQKTITCDEDVDAFKFIHDCSLNEFVFPSGGSIESSVPFDEIIINLGDTSEEHCSVTFTVLGDEGGQVQVVQELWINPPKEPVAGELLSIDSSALVIAGLTSSAAWMIPAVAGITGAGIYLMKLRTNRG